jgi:tRNA nucleotidyltransferase/poly(A) polymerase
MDEHGIVYDYTNGIDDLKMNRIRFNGNVITRLQENPIRILRYFR